MTDNEQLRFSLELLIAAYFVIMSFLTLSKDPKTDKVSGRSMLFVAISFGIIEGIFASPAWQWLEDIGSWAYRTTLVSAHTVAQGAVFLIWTQALALLIFIWSLHSIIRGHLLGLCRGIIGLAFIAVDVLIVMNWRSRIGPATVIWSLVILVAVTVNFFLSKD